MLGVKLRPVVVRKIVFHDLGTPAASVLGAVLHIAVLHIAVALSMDLLALWHKGLLS